MNIQRMHHEIKLRSNKINSNHYPDLPTAFIDDFLNEAQDLLVESICYPKKQNRFGIEGIQQDTDLISNITITDEPISVTLVSTGVYKLQLKNLSKKYKHITKLKVTTSCGSIPIEIVNHNELDAILTDENRKPSSLWRRGVGVFTSNKDVDLNSDILIYTSNQYTISQAFISYVYIPVKMFYGGYNSLEFINGDLTAPSNITPSINCELNINSHTYIVDYACLLINGSLENINGIQISESKIQKTI